VIFHQRQFPSVFMMAASVGTLKERIRCAHSGVNNAMIINVIALVDLTMTAL